MDLSVILAALAGAVLFGALSFVRFQRRFVPVLSYHYFTDADPNSSLEVAVQEFRRQANILRRLGYSVITLRQLISGEPLPRRAVVLTADDGDLTVFEKALPILEEFDYPLTVFVVVSSLETACFKLPGEVRVTADWEQVQDALRRHKRLEIGCHSWTHPALPACTAAERTREVDLAAQVLEQRLGIRADLFAYPFGRWSPSVLEQLRASRYHGACATTWGDPLKTERLCMEREPVYADTNTWQFVLKILGVYSFVRNAPGLRYLRGRRWGFC